MSNLHRAREHSRLLRWMMFVDGENLAIRGREFLRSLRMEPHAGIGFWPDAFLWWPQAGHEYPRRPTQVFSPIDAAPLEADASRWHYYSALKADDTKLTELKELIHSRGFTPNVFKKEGPKSKGVDISLAKDLLGHAHKDNYDAAVLVAGDGDYVPLVEEVKHIGKRVFLLFLTENHGLSPLLRRAADHFFSFEGMLHDHWRGSRAFTEIVPTPPSQAAEEIADLADDRLKQLEAESRTGTNKRSREILAMVVELQRRRKGDAAEIGRAHV